MRYFLMCLASFLIHTHLYAGQLIIGTLAYDPPFETTSDNKGNFFGFDIDIMNEVCNRLQEKCHYKPLTFEKILSETQSGQIDLAIAGISIMPNRQLLYLFSLPYLASRAGLLAKSNSTIKTIEDIQGKHIGVEAGTLFKTLALNKFPGVQITEYDTQNDLFQAVADDDVDLILLDEASAQYWMTNNGVSFKSVGKPIPMGVGYGIMANLSNSTLINRVNNALISMENDGSYLVIYKRYF